MQNIAECQNIAILGGKRLIAYSKLGLIIFKVRVRVNSVLKVRVKIISKFKKISKVKKNFKLKKKFQS